MNKICFFARLRDQEQFNIKKWYYNDVKILEELGFDIKIATRVKEIPLNCDLYYSWWATYSIFPVLISKLIRKPSIIVAGGEAVVQSIHNLPGGFHSKSKIVQQIIKYNLRNASSVISVSEVIKKEAELLGAKNTALIYNCVDVNEYKPSTSSDRNVIFTLSQITKNHLTRKCLIQILQAAQHVVKEYPSLKFVIAGKKSNKKAYTILKDRINEYKLEKNFILPGEISEQEKKQLFAKSLIYLQPTLHEGFGVAIAEAMSSGVPVISSASGAVPEVVGDCGLYVDPEDPNDIANKILKLVGDKKMRDRLSKKGRERVGQYFSYKIRKEKLAKLLDIVFHKKELKL